MGKKRGLGVYDFLCVRHRLTLSYIYRMRTSPTITISLPKSLLEMLDMMANDRHMTRSQFIREILHKHIETIPVDTRDF